MTPTAAGHSAHEVVSEVSAAEARLRAAFAEEREMSEEEVFDTLQGYSLASVSASIRGVLNNLLKSK